jgi:outer membrane protein OmpA-like peptidoglycan-associated protein
VEWYDGMFGRRGPQPATATAANKQPAQGDTARGFPNLSTVPERPQATEPAERKAVQAGLASDRKNAKYIDDVVRNRVAEAAAVSFDGASGGLDRAGQATLRRIADRQKLAGGGVRVVGYEPAAPLASGAKAAPPVSLGRAQAVAAELVRLGVNPQSIKVEGSMAREQAGRQAEIFLEN